MADTSGMSRWVGRVALVTGSSAGIGLCISEKLVNHGMIVVGCGRNVAAIEKLRDHCTKSGYTGKLHPYKCDLNKDSEIVAMFEWIKTSLGTGIDVCINNAGFTTGTPLLDVPPTEMRAMLDINVVALAYCSQLAIRSMIERNVNDGHVININSILGHKVLGVFNFYASSKHAVTALTEGFRKEVLDKGLRIKVTSISPGRTETHFLHTAYGAQNASKIYSSMENLQAEDVANSLIYVLSTPPHVQVGDILMEPMQPTTANTYPK